MSRDSKVAGKCRTEKFQKKLEKIQKDIEEKMALRGQETQAQSHADSINDAMRAAAGDGAAAAADSDAAAAADSDAAAADSDAAATDSDAAAADGSE